MNSRPEGTISTDSVVSFSKARAASSGGRAPSREPIVGGTGGGSGGGRMVPVEHLEQKIENLWRALAAGLIIALGALGGSLLWMDGKFDGLDPKFDRIDDKFTAVESKFDAVDTKFVSLHREMSSMNNTLGKIESSQQWLQDFIKNQDKYTHADQPAPAIFEARPARAFLCLPVAFSRAPEIISLFNTFTY